MGDKLDNSMENAVKIGRLEEKVTGMDRNVSERLIAIETRIATVEVRQESRYQETVKGISEIMTKLNEINNKVDGRLSRLEYTDQEIQKEAVMQTKNIRQITEVLEEHNKFIDEMRFLVKYWKPIVGGALFILVGQLIGFILLLNQIRDTLS